MILATLTPAERLVLEGRLAEAKTAFHALMTGTAARVVVDQNGERVEFHSSTRGALAAYIVTLEQALAITPASCRVMPPAQFVF